MASNEQRCTQDYATNAYGCSETPSGQCATLERTAELREHLPKLFQDLELTSLLDAGCGDWTWMSQVPLGSIQYIGADLVDDLLFKLQEYSSETVSFQKLDIVEDPPVQADMWLCRDILCFYPYADIQCCLERFVESNSRYIAITSIDRVEPNRDSLKGYWRPLNLMLPPFSFPPPEHSCPDGQQWFRKKHLMVFTREQIQDWLSTTPLTATVEVEQPSMVNDTQDKNAHLVSNIPLRMRSIRDHTG